MASSAASPAIPEKMKCILIKGGVGTSEDLYIGEEPTPKIKAGEVLVKVKAFGLNRMDGLQLAGKYPLPPQASKTILGVEFSGVIVDAGDYEAEWKVGDEVFGLTYGGAYAQYASVSSRMITRKPARLSWVEAAAVPENWLTAYQALVLEGGLKRAEEGKGEKVMVHAGASGVGVAANQLALLLGASQVFTTAGSKEKVDFLHDLAKDKVKAFNYKEQNFEEEVKKVSPGGVDLIIDFVGQNYWEKNLGSLAQDGRMVILGTLSGASLPAKSSLGPILFKRLTIKGSTLRSRSPEYQGDLLNQFRKVALDKLGGEEEGQMRIMIHKVYPWSEVGEAHREMEGNKNSGKIVLEIPEEAPPAPASTQASTLAAKEEPQFNDSELIDINKQLAGRTPQEILTWAIDSVKGLYQTTAFGLTGLAALDMVSKISLDRNETHLVPLIFLNTLYHFQETVDIATVASDNYLAPLHTYYPPSVNTQEAFEAKYGSKLWETDEDTYDYLVKVEPAQRAYQELGVKAVITGRRRSQGADRADLPAVEKDSTGLIKINPLINWSFKDVKAYVDKENVPYNPLLDQGYTSIGDWHSTDKPSAEAAARAAAGGNERAGRWQGKAKSECGLHKDYFDMKAAFEEKQAVANSAA